MKITYKHIEQIMSEARRRYIDLPGNAYLEGLDDTRQKVLSEGERMALSYFQGALLTLASNKLLCDGWEEKIQILIHTPDSEPAVD